MEGGKVVLHPFSKGVETRAIGTSFGEMRAENRDRAATLDSLEDAS